MHVDSMMYKLYWIEKAYLENNKITQSARDRDRSCNITWTHHSFTAVVSQITALDASDSTLSMTTNPASAECALRAGQNHHWNLIGQLITPLLAPNSNFEPAGSILTQYTRFRVAVARWCWMTDRRIELASLSCELTFYSLQLEQISLLKTVAFTFQI